MGFTVSDWAFATLSEPATVTCTFATGKYALNLDCRKEKSKARKLYKSVGLNYDQWEKFRQEWIN